MSATSKLATQLGFRLGGNDAFNPSAVTSVATTQGLADATLVLSVTASSFVFTRGNVAAVLTRSYKLAAQLGSVLGGNLQAANIQPNAIAGLVECLNFISAVQLSVVALGIVQTSANAAINQAVSALGTVQTQGFSSASVRTIGASSIVRSPNFAIADLSTSALGIATSPNFATATPSIVGGNSLSVVTCRGFVSAWRLTAFATSVVHTQGMCTIALDGDFVTCLEGPNGAIVSVKGNWAL